MAGRLAGKTALITGGAGGLGQAMARTFLAEGATVTVSDIDAGAAERLAGSLNADYPGRAFAQGHDVTQEDQWIAVLDRAVADMGSLSVLVHNAGIGGQLTPVTQTSIEDWRLCHAVNLDSVMLGTKHGLKHLTAAAPASIITISSIAAMVAGFGMGPYNASKAAVRHYTKTIALECAKMGNRVRANSVHPVFIKTPILDPFVAMSGGDEAAAHAKLARAIPLGHIGEPEDVAWLAVYLASDESKFVTGAEFVVDGGLTIQ